MQKITISLKIAGVLLPLWGAVGCEKVIDVPIRDSDTKVVIEGLVTQGTGPHTVRVSKSAPFGASGTGEPIDRAVVTIRTTAGQTDTLRSVGGGRYQTRRLVGTPGVTYTLAVVLDGTAYAATSTMPQPVLLDTLTQEVAAAGRRVVQAHYDDPADVANFYRFVVYVNDQRLDGVFVSDDRLRNGIRARTPIGTGPDAPEINPGDRVRVRMECIDARVYDYLKSLADLLGGQALTPANPNTNLSGGALGYFSAQTASTNSLTVP